MDVSIVFNGEIVVSPSVLNSVLVVLGLSLFFMLASRKVRKADPSEPSQGVVLFLELMVIGVEGLCLELTGDRKGRFGCFIGMLICYLVVANLLGLIGLTTPTSNYTVTLSLALVSLFYLNFSGARAKGLRTHMKDTFLGDFPVLLPLNVIGEFSKILSLSFRLFGNVLSGAVITAVLIYLLGWSTVVLMPVLNLYFDVFSGLLQTMIFSFLLMIWMGDTVPIDEL